MKKIISMSLVVILLLAISSASAAMRYSDMSMDDLMAVKNEVDAEIQRRTTNEQSQIIYDSDGIKVYFKALVVERTGTSSDFVLENDSQVPVEVTVKYASVNEWTFTSMWWAVMDAGSGMKALDSALMYEVEKLKIERIEKMSVLISITNTSTGEILLDDKVVSFPVPAQ